MASIAQYVPRGLKRRIPAGVRRGLAALLNGPARVAHSGDEDVSVLDFRIEGDRVLLSFLKRRGPKVPSAVVLWAWDGRSWTFPVKQDQSGLLTSEIDLRPLVEVERLSGVTVDLYLDWREVEIQPPLLQRLGKFDRTTRPPRAVSTIVSGTAVTVEPTSLGNLSLRFDNDHLYPIKADFPAIAWNDDSVTVTCRVRTHSRAITSAVLTATGRQSQQRHEFSIPSTLIEPDVAKNYGMLRYRLDVSIDFTRLAPLLQEVDDIVDLAIEVTVENSTEIKRIGLQAPSRIQPHHLRSAHATVGGEVFQFVPYLTFRNHRIAYRVERFTADNYAFMRRLQKVSWALPVIKPFAKVWLIGEMPYKAQDNGYQFFRYVRQHHPRRRAYYVIESTSPDKQRVAPYGNVVDRFSREHILYSFLASRIVGTHHAEALFVSRDLAVSRRIRGVRIFLQHGVTAMKNVTPNYARQGTYELPTERFIVTSELEQRIVTEDFGFAARQVPIGGFARFDELFAPAPPPERTILVMPTWRDTLVRTEKFLESDYFANWHGFLSDQRLQDLMADTDYTVTFVLHPNMRMFAEHFDIPHVRLVRQEEVDVQRLLKTSSVLITDFSSVAWDFAFLDRPVLYFQFDHQLLVNSRAPHIDFQTQLPGPVSTTQDALLRDVAAVLGRDAAMEPTYRERAGRFLAHQDQRNCERIFDIVEHAWTPLTAVDRIRNAKWVQRQWRGLRKDESYFRWMGWLYAVGRRLPRKNSVLFECDRGAHYGDAPRYLYERLIERDHGLQIFWSNNTTLRLVDPSTTKIKRHSPRYYWELSRAKYWVNNQNFPATLTKPQATRFLQTWHGTPLKRMQRDVPNMLSRDPGYQERAARLTSYWNVLLSASPYASRCFASAFGPETPIVELGYPRNDPFFWPDAAERSRLTRARLGLAEDHRKIILYAPTFRDDERKGINWTQKLALDIDRLACEFGDEFVLVVRFHQLVRESLTKLRLSRDDFLIDGSSYPDVQELLLVSDVLITDYSSIFFDFAALQRPVLFFTYDLEKYRQDLRGFYADIEQIAPGPLLATNEEVVAALKSLDVVTADYARRLAEFAAMYGPLDDGGASDRVLDAFFGSSDRARPVSKLEVITRAAH